MKPVAGVTAVPGITGVTGVPAVTAVNVAMSSPGLRPIVDRHAAAPAPALAAGQGKPLHADPAPAAGRGKPPHADLAPAAGRSKPLHPPFDLPVASGGYAWWYLDALSDDGAHGLTVIAFIGSVFSPYYAWARRQAPGGAADPAAHCTLNVVLYERQGGGGGRWAMTERGRSQLDRSATRLAIGPSALHWQGDSLRIDIDEVTAPIPRRLRGSVTVHAPCRFDRTFTLAPGHRWCPIAPMARVEVDLGTARWQGPAYFDSNHGDAALERGFDRWEWSRATTKSGDALVFYDAEPLHGAPVNLGLRFRRDGGIDEVESPPAQAMAPTGWRIRRHGRSDAGSLPTVLQTLTDAPFYARSLLAAQWQGEPVVAVHESLSLQRFARPWVQAMLPFRMPRRGG